jgi:hypothetical protein
MFAALTNGFVRMDNRLSSEDGKMLWVTSEAHQQQVAGRLLRRIDRHQTRLTFQ